MAATESSIGEMEISVPWDEVAKESKRILAAFRKQVRIPGFRPGKAPEAVIRMRYAEEVRGELLETLVPKHFWKRAEEQDLKVIGSPDISDVHYADDEPLTFKAKFEVIPDFELGDYRRLQAPFAEPLASEEEIDAEIERVREQQASYRNLDPRPLEDGDVAVLSLKSGEVEGVPQVDQEETTITIGDEGTLDGFTEALRGKSPDDEVDFEVTYPEDFGNEKLAGKIVPFHAVVKGIRVKELPEVDDQFASDVGDFKTLEELRKAVREGIENMRRREATERAKDAVIDQLVASHDFTAPSKMVEQQVNTRLERSLRSIAKQGIDPAQLNLDWEKLREGQREGAVRDVKAGLLLERIAEVEAIDATEEEIDEQVKHYAEQNQLSAAGARQKLAEDGTLDRVRTQIRNDKTAAFLFDEAEKVDPPEEEPETEKASSNEEPAASPSDD